MIMYLCMAKIKRSIILSISLLFLMSAISGGIYNSAAAQTPSRQTTIIVPVTEYEWWMIRWSDNQISCRILVDHEGIPTAGEVLDGCGTELYNAWLATPPCKQIVKGNQNTSACTGYYMHLASSRPVEREVVIELPVPVIWLYLEGCSPVPPDNYCTTLPSLLLVGEEPLPNEKITSIQGTYGDLPFYCDGDRCVLPLKATPVLGVTVEFWADSSYGDSSEKFTAQVRVVDSGVSSTPGGGGYYVDVLSTQWRGEPLTSCAKTWEVFPPVGGLPEWLSTPEESVLLLSDEAYFYLAGRLIAQGVVDASSCATTGLLPNGYADACGLEKARLIVETWQNQFDERIIEVSQETSIPAQLLKNLFAQESQFWPGVFRVPYEFGLGQITDNGADAILLWNEEFFEQFCPLVLAEDACEGGYLKLKPDEQAILRGALAIEANSNCSDCPAGVDLSHASMSVSLFAGTLKANCEQVATIVNTATEEIPGKVSNYEDLWRFTVANYHAGPGCLSYAIHMAWLSNPGPLTWETVSTQFTEACRGVIPYVEKITR